MIVNITEVSLQEEHSLVIEVEDSVTAVAGVKQHAYLELLSEFCFPFEDGAFSKGDLVILADQRHLELLDLELINVDSRAKGVEFMYLLLGTHQEHLEGLRPIETSLVLKLIELLLAQLQLICAIFDR
jgi:hypothetical protein